MSLIKQKSTAFQESNESSNHQLYALYDEETKTFVIDCLIGTTYYLKVEDVEKLNNDFKLKIINVYKNLNKPIKLIYRNCLYFCNKLNISDKNDFYIFGSEDDFKFPLFFNGIPIINNNNNKYIEQSFIIDCIENENLCITTIKTAY